MSARRPAVSPSGEAASFRVIVVSEPVEEIGARVGDCLSYEPEKGRIVLARSLGCGPERWAEVVATAQGYRPQPDAPAPQYPFLARLGAPRGGIA